MVKAFLIADSVIQDRSTGKWSVVGIFDQIYAPKFPCQHGALAIYVKLSDALGKYAVRVEFRDVGEDRLVSAFEGINLEVKDRLKGPEFGVPTHGLPLEKPGKYQFVLFFNGEYGASATLDVRKLENPPARGRPGAAEA